MGLLLSQLVVSYVDVIRIPTAVSLQDLQELLEILESMFEPVSYRSLDINDARGQIGNYQYELVKNMKKVEITLSKTL